MLRRDGYSCDATPAPDPARVRGRRPRASRWSPHFKLEQLADGVYAAVRTDPPGWGANANNLFVIDADGVVVVDTNFGPSSTKDVLKALAHR